MKTNKFKTAVMLVAIAMAGILSAQAQQGRGPAKGIPPAQGPQRILNCIPDLTEAQEVEINDLTAEHMKEVKLLRLDVKELQIQKQRLEMLGTADQNDMDAKIDEIYKVKAEIAKSRNAHHAAVYALLTDEQKTAFDAAKHHRRGGKQGFDGHGKQHPKGKGQGRS